MKFKTVGEAFNHYRNTSVEDIEKRSAEIKATLNEDGNVDIEALNIEVEGLKQAKENIEEKEDRSMNFNPITQRSFENKKVEDSEIFASTEYRNAFYKQLLGQDLDSKESQVFNRAMELQKVERRVDQFNTTTNSASVLPTQTLNEVVSKARKEGGLLAHCRQFNIPSNLSIPVGTPSTKAQWHDEGTTVESEQVTPVNVEFAGYEIIKVFSISAAAKKMSISAFESYLVNELTSCVMECIADSLINGTGTKQGTGLETGIVWDTDNSIEFPNAGDISYTDFTQMLGMLERGYSGNAKFVMNNATLYNQVYSLVDGNQRPLFIADPKNESIGHILGKEIIIDDNLADDVVILGDFNYMGYNMPEGIMLEVSRESSFKSGLIDYRALAIADTKPIVSEAFVKLSREVV